MNYGILIIIGVAGIVLGVYMGRLRRVSAGTGAGTDVGAGSGERKGDDVITEQAKKKVENKEKILEFLRENGKIQNNDVERIAGVSNATAERYLDGLEKEAKLTQHGSIGPGVFYTLK